MANKVKKILLTLVVLLLSFGLICCNEVDDPPVQDVSISISGVNTVVVGETINLVADVANSSEKVTWSSSDTKLATIDENGVVVGVKAGSVTITASIGDVKQEYNVSVKNKVNQNVSLFCGTNLITAEPTTYEKVELAICERNMGYIKQNYNPFDYSKLYVYAVFTSPSNKLIMAPAFWYRDYQITLNSTFSSGSAKEGEPSGTEMVQWVSEEYEYRLRFQPDEAGEWTYNIYVTIEGVVTETLNGSVRVQDSEKEYKGIIQVDKSNNRTFMYGDGTTFMPIGENMGWWADNSRKTYDYYVWFSNAHQNNMNICRIWMAPWGFCLHWGKSMYDYTDRLNYAARLDRVFEYADQFDMYIMLCLLNHGQFSSNTDSKWSENPYNTKNGGILDKPNKFFNTPEAKETYRNELLYIIGRYGYSDKIMCWELFNEVDWTDNADINAVNIKQWHKEMATFIKNNDSYGHMVSTSYKTEYGSAFTLDEIDFACPHSYGYANKNICASLPTVLDKLYGTYKKPILHAEIGIDWENGYNNYKLDPTGVSLRQASWAGMLGGGCGGAMNWWWDSYVHPYNLYYQFAGAGAYAKLMNLNGSDYTQLRTLSGVSTTSGTGIIGYRFNNRIYGYVYDNAWKYNNATSKLTNVSVTIPFTDGTYNLKVYNATTGILLDTFSLNVTGGNANFTLPSFTSDIAFIVE